MRSAASTARNSIGSSPISSPAERLSPDGSGRGAARVRARRTGTLVEPRRHRRPKSESAAGPSRRTRGSPGPKPGPARRGWSGERPNFAVDTSGCSTYFASTTSTVDPPRARPWREGPGFYLLRVVPRPGVTVDRVVNRVDEIALSLALPAGLEDPDIARSRDHRLRGSEGTGGALPRFGDRPVGSLPASGGPTGRPIGEDIAGRAGSIEFSSPDSPHLLVAGTTGSGKSVALETLCEASAAIRTDVVRLHLVDPKGTELVDFADDPHTDGEIGMDGEDAIAILEAAVAEMQERYQRMRPVRARSLAEYNAAVPEEDRLPWRRHRARRVRRPHQRL